MERWIIKIKVHALNWNLKPGETIMVDVVSKNFAAGTATLRSVYDGQTTDLRIDSFDILSMGGRVPTGTSKPTQGGLL